MYKSILVVSTTLLLSACSGANVTSQVRDFNAANSNNQLRCTTFSTDSSSANKNLAAYDGWTMVYASEYTTDNKSTTEMTVCFEKSL
ncbi:hypothetical protein DLR60_16175 [Vibrio tarriae]|uniref:hypothetical protein n=1 Tax=Vibrio tarriae TaxID=2014742 RepID=UPI000DE3BEA6|nr:hypothetical protein [Vibrio tarriae]RBM66720.1 hypothetical protein DLR60_16175 [Vibrio tarriae]